MAAPRVWRCMVWMAVAVSNAACGILGADEYGLSDDPPADPERPAEAGPPRPATYGWVPGMPDAEFVERCAGCAKERCGHERNLCLLPDSDCWERLECASECSDPNCLQACESEQFVVGRACEDTCDDDFCMADCWAGRDRYQALDLCLFGGVFGEVDNCEAECNTGRNMACVGEYEWPVSAQSIDVRLKLGVLWGAPGGAPLYDVGGALVSVCLSGPPCFDRASAEQADEYGVLDLSGFRGMSFSVVSETRPAVSVHLVRNHPQVRPTEVRYTVLPGPPLIHGSILDCLGHLASGVEVVIDEPGLAYEVHYWDADTSTFAPGPGTPRRNSLFQVVDLPLPGRDVSVVVRRDGSEIGRIYVPYEDGWSTRVLLVPASRR